MQWQFLSLPLTSVFLSICKILPFYESSQKVSFSFIAGFQDLNFQNISSSVMRHKPFYFIHQPPWTSASSINLLPMLYGSFFIQLSFSSSYSHLPLVCDFPFNFSNHHICFLLATIAWFRSCNFICNCSDWVKKVMCSLDVTGPCWSSFWGSHFPCKPEFN